jgi:hypothetical protein
MIFISGSFRLNPSEVSFWQNTNFKRLVFLLSVLSLAVIINYSRILYYKIKPERGTWASIYTYYTIPSASLINILDKFNSEEMLKVKTIKSDKSNYLEVIFYDKKERNYFFTWFSSDTVAYKKFSQIILSHIGKDTSITTAKAINKEFTLIDNARIKSRFENNISSFFPEDRKNN